MKPRFSICRSRRAQNTSMFFSSTPTSTISKASTAGNGAKGSSGGGQSNALGIAFFASICMGTAGLGVWQMQRYNWKIGVMEDIKKKMNDPPELIPSFSQNHLVEYVNQLTGRRVSVTGILDHANEVLVGPRTAPAGLIGTAAQGLATNPQGFYVITPLVRSDETVVFINRGWVDQKENTWERPQGVVTISTVVSKPESASTFSPANNPSTKRLLWLEADALKKAANRPLLAPSEVVVLEHFEPDDVLVTSYPAARRQKHLSEQHVTPLTHLVYATTWFSLSVAGLVMTFSMFGRKGGLRRARKFKDMNVPAA